MFGAGLARFDADGRLAWANPAFVRLLGGVGVGTTLGELVVDHRWADAGAARCRLAAGGMATLRREDGVRLRLAAGDDGEGGTLVSVALDDQDQADGQSAPDREGPNRESLLNTSFEAMFDAVAIFDRNLDLALCNGRFVAFFGLPAELTRAGTPFRAIIAFLAERGDYGEVDVASLIALREKEARCPESRAIRLIRANGKVVDVRHCPLPGGGFLRRYTDITDVANVAESQTALIEAIGLPLVVSRLSDGLALMGNEPAAAFFGASKEESLGRRHAEEAYADPGERERLIQALVAGGGRVEAFETRLNAAGGRIAWATLSASRMRYNGEDALLVCITDISERVAAEAAARAAREEAERALRELKQTQAFLIQREKMAALGGLVAGIAHEISTPVGVALSGASLLAERTRALMAAFEARRLTRAEFVDFVDIVAEASDLMLLNIDRAAQLIQSFKRMAVDQASGERRSFDLADYIHEVLRSLGVRLRRAAHRVEVACPAELIVDGYPGALSQILTNLVMNSLMHAYRPGETGCLSITARAVEGGWIELVYADDGQGIPAPSRARVFEPFFTTARAVGGSGLGLNIVFTLVTGTLKGRIDLDDTPGSGARFRLFFPRSM